jgi:hypothetical protein
MRPCPTLEYAAVVLLVAGLIAVLWGLGRAVSEPLTEVKQTLEDRR